MIQRSDISRRHRFGSCLRVGGLLCLLALSACEEEVYSGLSEREANEMVATLLRHGIDASREVAKDKTATVRVDESRFADAIEILKANGYPQPKYANMGEIFANDGLIASPVEERARLIYALSQELSQTVADIDGVLSARVHIVLPENDPLRESLTPSSASVFIRHDRAVAVEPLLPQIKMLVANGIAGLAYEKVSVVLIPVDVQGPQERAAVVHPPLKSAAIDSAHWLFYGMSIVVAGIGSGLTYLWRRRRSSADDALATQ